MQTSHPEMAEKDRLHQCRLVALETARLAICNGQRVVAETLIAEARKIEGYLRGDAQ